MAIKNFKSRGLSVLELCCIFCVVLPILFNLVGIIDYFRIQYLLDELIENEFGNRKIFIVKINEDLTIDNSEKNNIQETIKKKVDSLEAVFNKLTGKVSEKCQYAISGALIEKSKNDAMAKLFKNEYKKGSFDMGNINLENYSSLSNQKFVINKDGNQVFLDTSLAIRLSITLDFNTCSKIGSDFLNIMPSTISSFKNIIVDFEF